ncbi:hypothetical protein [Anaerotruncus colihominis]|uniref:Uncharacterized protein n=1 Tax=Anaerotruncus colihominis TaxID=169435 RepID=A0A1Y4MFZ7_9FIRM|nr:hypothetical protein [Anaerotruncus colihominis]OUP67697.1 hypothetical protein B5F11_17030 [Anaerotruncus colihominis]OUP71813.1 hypothetical protein B5F10_17335 [Anaerotruncus colihominis]
MRNSGGTVEHAFIPLWDGAFFISIFASGPFWPVDKNAAPKTEAFYSGIFHKKACESTEVCLRFYVPPKKIVLVFGAAWFVNRSHLTGLFFAEKGC